MRYLLINMTAHLINDFDPAQTCRILGSFYVKSNEILRLYGVTMEQYYAMRDLSTDLYFADDVMSMNTLRKCSERFVACGLIDNTEFCDKLEAHWVTSSHIVNNTTGVYILKLRNGTYHILAVVEDLKRALNGAIAPKDIEEILDVLPMSPGAAKDTIRSYFADHYVESGYAMGADTDIETVIMELMLKAPKSAVGGSHAMRAFKARIDTLEATIASLEKRIPQ